MKNIFTLILTSLLFIGCGSDKKIDPTLAGMIQEDGSIINVKSDPVTVSLKVTNSTDQDQTFKLSYGIDAKDTLVTIKAKTTEIIESNCSGHDCTEWIAVNPGLIGPAGTKNPSSGEFRLSWQIVTPGLMKMTYWDESGQPMDDRIYSADVEWKYELAWGTPVANDSGQKISAGNPWTNSLEIKTVKCTTVADPSSPTGFSCN
jgi:hypothetical protein